MELLAILFTLAAVIFATQLNDTLASWNIEPNLITDIRESIKEVITFPGLNNKTYPAGFKIVLIDNENIIIGSTNLVYILSLNGLQLTDIIEWTPGNNDGEVCKSRMKTKWECQNHIRVLVKSSANQLFICGTNAFKPRCRTYNRSRDSNTYSKSFVDDQNGIGMCSFDPNYNNTAILAGDWLVSGTVADFAARDALIYGKSIDPTDNRPKLRTEQFASDVLNEPNFVQSLEYEDKIYFFFRETAVEAINCRKTVYSRVGRVCKNDQGGKSLLQENWSSFFKSRLNCSVPGNFPFYFDEIQATSAFGQGSYMQLREGGYTKTDLIYAVFNTPENSIHGSAVCAFSFQDIIKTFEGPFKEKKSSHSNWLPLLEAETPQPHPAKYCSNDSVTDLATLNFIKAHPLMDKAVRTFGGKPVFVQTSLEYRLTVLTVDWQVYTSDDKTYDVLFIGTTDGRVLKTTNIFQKHSNQSNSILIEDILIFTTKNPIVNLQVHKEEFRLLVVSKSEIKSIPLQRCYIKKTCSACVGLQDPYCSWNNGQCECSRKGLQNVDTGWHTNCKHIPKTAQVIATNESNFSAEMITTITFVFIALFTGLFIGVPIGCYLDYKYCIYR